MSFFPSKTQISGPGTCTSVSPKRVRIVPRFSPLNHAATAGSHMNTVCVDVRIVINSLATWATFRLLGRASGIGCRLERTLLRELSWLNRDLKFRGFGIGYRYLWLRIRHCGYLSLNSRFDR